MPALIQTLQDTLALNNQVVANTNAELENILVLLKRQAELDDEVQQLASHLQGICGELQIQHQILSTEMKIEVELRNACLSGLVMDDNDHMDFEVPRGYSEPQSLAGQSAVGLLEGDSDPFTSTISPIPQLDDSLHPLGDPQNDFDMSGEEYQFALPQHAPDLPAIPGDDDLMEDMLDNDPMATMEATVHQYIESHSDVAVQISMDAILSELLPLDLTVFNFTAREKAILMVLYQSLEGIYDQVLETTDDVHTELDRLDCVPHPALEGLFRGIAHRVEKTGDDYRLLIPVDTTTADNESAGISNIIALVAGAAHILLGEEVPQGPRQINGGSLGLCCAGIASVLRCMKGAWRKYRDKRQGRNGH